MFNTSPERTQAAPQADAQIVTFEVGAESFGIDIALIIEVIRPLPITALPHMPRFVQGVINLRGTIIPVVDLRERFGQTEERRNARTMRMIITRGGEQGASRLGRLLGLVVDSVQEVLQIPVRSIGPAPEGARGERAEFITGVAKVEDRLIILLDVSRILSRSERTALAEADNVIP